nr:hypothetical protein [Tanacetum cinerariifolium]
MIYDLTYITKHIEHVTKLTTENVNLKTSVSEDKVKPQVLAREKHAIDVEPIVPRLRNNRDAHLDYLRHLKESVETIRDIVEEAKVIRPLDRSIVSACRYTKHSQELLEYAIGTCPQRSQQRAKQLAHIPLSGKKQVSIAKSSDKSDIRFTEMHVANTTIEARCLALKAELANLRDKSHHDNQEELINHFSKHEITKLTDQATILQAQNDLFRAKNDKIKQHYKELYDSIKITRAKHIEQVTKLTTKNVIMKTSVSKDEVKPQVLTREKYAIDVEPIIPRLRNNRDAHLDYLRHL